MLSSKEILILYSELQYIKKLRQVNRKKGKKCYNLVLNFPLLSPQELCSGQQFSVFVKYVPSLNFKLLGNFQFSHQSYHPNF